MKKWFMIGSAVIVGGIVIYKVLKSKRAGEQATKEEDKEDVLKDQTNKFLAQVSNARAEKFAYDYQMLMGELSQCTDELFWHEFTQKFNEVLILRNKHFENMKDQETARKLTDGTEDLYELVGRTGNEFAKRIISRVMENLVEGMSYTIIEEEVCA